MGTDGAEERAEPSIEHETAVVPPARSQRARTALLVIFFVGSLAAAKLTGLDEHLDVERVRAFMDSAGALGFLAFLAIFTIGELLHVPGLVFVGAASIAYGEVLGIAAGYTGAMVSVATSFLVVRAIGGQPLGDVKRPWMRTILARLEARPIRTVALLRLVFFMSPALNYGLAMSPVRLREYLIGSALGLAIPIPAAVLFFDWLARWL
ncbi:MAG TPA: VTT domain-containing protein [Sandaracinaceae bacterium]